jgi:hypothetical protein
MSSFGGTLDLIFLCEIQILHAHVGFLKGFAELWWGIANSSLVYTKPMIIPLLLIEMQRKTYVAIAVKELGIATEGPCLAIG